MTKSPSAPRCAALVGPYLSGKTSLLESVLSLTGAVSRKGSVRDGNTVGDGTAEARARQMSTETQHRDDGVPGRNLDLPRLSRLHRAGSGRLQRADGGRPRRRRLRAGAAEGADPGAAAALPRRSRHSAHRLHQQDGPAGRQRPRDAGGAARSLRAPAGAARNPDPRRREDQRLRRSGERARLPLDGGAALATDPAARCGCRRGQGGARRHAGGDRRLRRRAAGEAAGRHRTESRRDLRRARAGSAAGPDRAGVLRVGRRHARHHPAAEGAAARGAGADADGGAARLPRGRAMRAGIQDAARRAHRQAVAGPGLAGRDRRRHDA